MISCSVGPDGVVVDDMLDADGESTAGVEEDTFSR